MPHPSPVKCKPRQGHRPRTGSCIKRCGKAEANYECRCSRCDAGTKREGEVVCMDNILSHGGEGCVQTHPLSVVACVAEMWHVRGRWLGSYGVKKTDTGKMET